LLAAIAGLLIPLSHPCLAAWAAAEFVPPELELGADVLLEPAEPELGLDVLLLLLPHPAASAVTVAMAQRTLSRLVIDPPVCPIDCPRSVWPCRGRFASMTLIDLFGGQGGVDPHNR